MSKPVFFADLDKSTQDLLTKGFYGNKIKVDFKTKASNNANFCIAATRAQTGAISGDFTLGRSFTNNGVNYKLESVLGLDGKVSVKSTISGLQKGLDININGETTTASGDNQTQIGTVGLKYKHDHFTVTSDIKKQTNKNLVLTASATAAYEQFTVGGNVKVEGFAAAQKVGNTEVVDAVASDIDYNTGVSYTGKDYLVSFKALEKMNKVAVGYVHRLNTTTTVGAEFTHKIVDTKDRDILVLGGQYIIDADSNIKAKINSKGLLSIAYTNRLNKNLTASISAEVDTTDFSKGSVIGAQLTFDA
eukprot:GEZU01017338.1.p3 GENE.GEZU01017338.1~~GEZU01017338.1.p3  ORF type:complete len:304 (-),score=177.71 GEZU01017338.1:1290-2201(-)